MDDKEQARRERAYKIWEDEGRADGLHDDHWKRADDQGELTDQESADITQANQEADDHFAKSDGETNSVKAKRSPSIVSPD